MYLADLVIGAATKDGALSGCEKKFIDMKPPDNSAKLETSRMPNDNPGCPIKEALAPWPMTPSNASKSAPGGWNAALSRRVEVKLFAPKGMIGKKKKPADQCRNHRSTGNLAGKDAAQRFLEQRFARQAEPTDGNTLRVLSSSFSSDEITMEEGGQDLAGVMGPSYERQFPRQRDSDDDVRQADSFIEEV